MVPNNNEGEELKGEIMNQDENDGDSSDFELTDE